MFFTRSARTVEIASASPSVRTEYDAMPMRNPFSRPSGADGGYSVGDAFSAPAAALLFSPLAASAPNTVEPRKGNVSALSVTVFSASRRVRELLIMGEFGGGMPCKRCIRDIPRRRTGEQAHGSP